MSVALKAASFWDLPPKQQRAGRLCHDSGARWTWWRWMGNFLWVLDLETKRKTKTNPIAFSLASPRGPRTCLRYDSKEIILPFKEKGGPKVVGKWFYDKKEGVKGIKCRSWNLAVTFEFDVWSSIWAARFDDGTVWEKYEYKVGVKWQALQLCHFSTLYLIVSVLCRSYPLPTSSQRLLARPEISGLCPRRDSLGLPQPRLAMKDEPSRTRLKSPGSSVMSGKPGSWRLGHCDNVSQRGLQTLMLSFCVELLVQQLSKIFNFPCRSSYVSRPLDPSKRCWTRAKGQKLVLIFEIMKVSTHAKPMKSWKTKYVWYVCLFAYL